MQEKFCGKCGRPLDTATGKCPVCDKYQTIDADEAQMTVAPVPVVAEKKDKKLSEGKKTALIVSAIVLVFAVALTGILIAVLKKDKQPEKKLGNEEVEAVETTYITYLNEHLIPEMGGVITEGYMETETGEGIHSVSLTDMDGDGMDEMLVFYSKHTGERLSECIACYEYDETAEHNVSQRGEYESVQELNLGLNADNESTALYSVEVNGKTYYVYENRQVGMYGDAVVKIFVFENGRLVELANVYETDWEVYSTNLPDSIEIDNSDFFSYIPKVDYISDIFDGDTKYLYYEYREDLFDEEPSAVYDKYYDNSDKAVEAVFESFGIKRNYSAKVRTEGATDRNDIELPDGAKAIYTYAGWFEGDEMRSEIKDYSDLQRILKQTAAKTTAAQTVTTTKPVETTTAAPLKPLTAAELQEAEDFIDCVFVFGCENYNCNNISYEEYIKNFELSFFAGSGIYNMLYGGHETFYTPDHPDPLNRFTDYEQSAEYTVLSKSNIDWIAENVLNIPMEKINNADMTAACSAFVQEDIAVDAYCYNNNYYIAKTGGWGWSSGIKCLDSKPLGDGKYIIYVGTYDPEEQMDKEELILHDKGEVIVQPKTVDGKKIWSVYSSKITWQGN